MNQLDYTYAFSRINTSLCSVQRVDHQANKDCRFDIGVNDSQLLFTREHQLPSYLADWIDLAVAVIIADRLSKRRGDLSCNIHLILPLRHPEVFESLPIIKNLQDVLYWYTNDNWSFEFQLRTGHRRAAELQLSMFMPPPPDQPVHVSLWSGGLDSLGGAYHYLSQDPSSHHILFGTGLSLMIYNKQRQVAGAINKIFPGRTSLRQVFIQLAHTHKMSKNHVPRARGFLFLLLGAVCALMEGQKELFIYENGIGAINLPYRRSEVGLDHTRSVHPVSLIRMGELVSRLLGQPFTFRNPCLWQTKAQVCETLAQSAPPDLIALTFTCDHAHRSRPMQCGYCSSCLLRRQALAVLGVQDATQYVITAASARGDANRHSYEDYFQATRYQVDSLRRMLNDTNPWGVLSGKHPELCQIVDEMAGPEQKPQSYMIAQLLHLYRRYTQEWERVQGIISREFVRDDERDLMSTHPGLARRMTHGPELPKQL